MDCPNSSFHIHAKHGGGAYDRMGIAGIAVEGSDVVSYQASL